MLLLKKLGKIVSYGLIVILLGIGILFLFYSKPLPSAEKGPKANILAKKMLKALHEENYIKTRYLEWSFNGGAHQYKWDKLKGIAIVKWKDNIVTLHFFEPNKNKALVKNKEVNGTEKTKLLEKATSYFNNDSFWLVAPYKVFDKGTERSIVTLENGEEALLISYTQGNSTPGDSYLWKLQPNGFPKSYQMWVKIIPIGGLEASWNDWQEMESGISLPLSHQIGPFTLSMENVKAYK